MNTQILIRWAGLAALVAGMCFVIVELLRPPVVLASLTTTRWAGVHGLAIAMSMFGLLGVTGIYARQAHAAGWLGLASYLLLSLWLALSLPFYVLEGFVLPLLAAEVPALAEGFLGMFTRSAGATNFVTSLPWPRTPPHSSTRICAVGGSWSLDGPTPSSATFNS